jgi:hypothetical protein
MKIELGKNYAVIGVNEAMAVTVLEFVSVDGIHKNSITGSQLLFGRKSKIRQTVNIDGHLVFEGTELPFTTDFMAVQQGIHDTFSGNGCINLAGKGPIEEVRRFIEAYNLNPETDLGNVYFMDVPVFPELCEDFMEVSASFAGR